MATPRYRVIADTFIAPDMIRAGSVIETDAAPGAHLAPLNQEAYDRLDAWYDEEHPVLDPKDGTDTGKKWKPHARFRPRKDDTPEFAATHTLISAPPKDEPGGLSLAEAATTRATDFKPPAPEHSDTTGDFKPLGALTDPKEHTAVISAASAPVIPPKKA